jgi:hypothetical protein
MRAYHFEEIIGRPPSEVWSVLTNLSVAPKWRPLIVSMETIDGGPLAVGKPVKIVAEAMGRRAERESMTTALDPNRRWSLKSTQPTIEGTFDFLLEAVAGGTKVTAICDLTAKSWKNRLLLPLIARGERRVRVEMLSNLKRLVESGG